MANKVTHILFVAALALLSSCSVSKSALLHYYRKNYKTLDSIEAGYKQLYAKKHFNVGFSDGSFNYISITIITDTLQYIYEFSTDEGARLQDTLLKYKMNAPAIINLIKQMQSVRCTWINSVDYYINNKQMFMVFLSAKAIVRNTPFAHKKYYILAYFPEKQYFDDEGRLFASTRRHKLRKINNEVYNKLNDRVCYTISENFR